jgi:multisubunit Na+/H+ antiporter MnhB subunit
MNTNIKFKIFIILLLIITFVIFIKYYNYEISSFKSDTDYYIKHATELNIKNMVTSIYLGTRSFDTFLEVMVVISTVVCMEYLKNKL